MNDETDNTSPPKPEPQPVEQTTTPVPAASEPIAGTLEPTPLTEPESAVEVPAPPPSAPIVSPPPPPVTVSVPNLKQSAGAHMREVVQAKKRARLEKIILLANEKRIITNNDVEKLLKISDATATNYLRELVRAGRIKKTGVRAGTQYETI